MDALLDDLRADIDGGEVASRAYLSRYHFDRLVRAAVGESPARLRRRILLEQAAYALARGATVTDVAGASGYGSPEAFSRAFSRAHGSPPRTAFVDAVCEPPETFTYGGAVAHVLTFSAYRRTEALLAFHAAGYRDLGLGDPMHFDRHQS